MSAPGTREVVRRRLTWGQSKRIESAKRLLKHSWAASSRHSTKAAARYCVYVAESSEGRFRQEFLASVRNTIFRSAHFCHRPVSYQKESGPTWPSDCQNRPANQAPASPSFARRTPPAPPRHAGHHSAASGPCGIQVRSRGRPVEPCWVRGLAAQIVRFGRNVPAIRRSVQLFRNATARRLAIANMQHRRR